MTKDRMFQYYYDDGIYNSMMSFSDTKCVEDTGLITKKEADELWDKYYNDVVKRIEKDERPYIVIWKDCNSETDYNTIEKEIDYNDCEVSSGKVFKISRELIN